MMKILCCPHAGGEPKNPAYVPDNQYLRCLDLAVKMKCEWVSFPWAFDYIWADPEKPRHERLLWVVSECVERGLAPIMINQASVYPNQPKWVNLAGQTTWYPTCPPVKLWDPIAHRCSETLNVVWNAMIDLGVDPTGCGVWQPHREPGVGGVGQSETKNMKEGTWSTAVKNYIQYLTYNVNTLGFLMASPSLECQLASFDKELETAFDKSWARYDLIFAHLYEWKDSPTTRAIYQSMLIRDRLLLNGIQDRDIVWAEMGHKDTHDVDFVRAKMVESQVNNCGGAAWYCALGETKWSFLPYDSNPSVKEIRRPEGKPTQE